MVATKADIQVILDFIDKEKGKLNKRLKDISGQSRITQRGMDNLGKQYSQLEKHNKTLDRALGKFNMQFQGWAMSVMFFGMALQRVFFGIWKSASKTFNDVIHSVDGAVTGFDMLGGSIKYLQFTAGAALEPLAYALIPIIDNITELINKYPELTRFTVKWGAILGTIFMIGGTGALAIAGFMDLGAKLGLLKTDMSGVITKASALKTALKFGQSIIGVSLIMEGVSDVAAGETFDGLVDMLTGAGFLALAGGKKKAGIAAIGIGVALSLVDAIIDGGGKLSRNALADWFIKAGAMGMFAIPGVGAALLTFGIAFKYVPGKYLASFVSSLGILIGALVLSVAVVLDAALVPIITIMKGLVALYNLVTGSDIKAPSYGGLSTAAYDKFKEQIDSAKEIYEKPQEGETTYNYNVVLPDGSVQVMTGNETVQDTFDVTLRAAGAVE